MRERLRQRQGDILGRKTVMTLLLHTLDNKESFTVLAAQDRRGSKNRRACDI